MITAITKISLCLPYAPSKEDQEHNGTRLRRQPQQQQLWQQHPEWEIVAHEAFHWWRRGPALGEGPDQGLHERVSHDDVSGEHAVGLRDKKEEQLQGKGAYSDC